MPSSPCYCPTCPGTLRPPLPLQGPTWTTRTAQRQTTRTTRRSPQARLRCLPWLACSRPGSARRLPSSAGSSSSTPAYSYTGGRKTLRSCRSGLCTWRSGRPFRTPPPTSQTSISSRRPTATSTLRHVSTSDCTTLSSTQRSTSRARTRSLLTGSSKPSRKLLCSLHRSTRPSTTGTGTQKGQPAETRRPSSTQIPLPSRNAASFPSMLGVVLSRANSGGVRSGLIGTCCSATACCTLSVTPRTLKSRER
mmetsp:Transcript_27791/g.64086  ORF Transcript_27791/g.64086 Transcript_27791/m.64086 type:complete len:250 (-) Transcript_27791:862-1611(-)